MKPKHRWKHYHLGAERGRSVKTLCGLVWHYNRDYGQQHVTLCKTCKRIRGY